MNDDVGKGLGHGCGCDALIGLEGCGDTVDLGLRSLCSLQPRLSHWGLSAPTDGAQGAPGARFRPRLPSARDTERPKAGVLRAESPSCDSLGWSAQRVAPGARGQNPSRPERAGQSRCDCRWPFGIGPSPLRAQNGRGIQTSLAAWLPASEIRCR